MSLKSSWNFRIGLGTASFIPQYGLRHESRHEEPQKVLEQAFMEGVDYFDTAPVYQDAETALGKFTSNRARYRVVSKISAASLQNISKAMQDLQQSVDRLQGKLDGLLIHNGTEANVRDPRVACAMKELQKRFNISRIGVSTYGIHDALVANESEWCESIQFEGSVLNTSVIRVLSEKGKKSKEWICRSVLTQGLLAGVEPKTSHPRLERSLNQFFFYASDWGYSPVALAIHYVLGYPEIDKVILGAASLEEWGWISKANHQNGLDQIQMEKLKELDLSDLDAVHPQKWNS